MKGQLVAILALLLGGQLIAKDLEEQKEKGDVVERPVYMILGMVVTFPPGVEEPPKGFEGTMRGLPPSAIIKREGNILGEIYAAPLKGTAKEEADGMKRSAAKSEQIDLVKRESVPKGKLPHEVTTIQMNLPRKLGNPWVFHSIYFPKKEGSVTFKLVAAEKEFKKLLPVFKAMFFDGNPARKD